MTRAIDQTPLICLSRCDNKRLINDVATSTVGLHRFGSKANHRFESKDNLVCCQEIQLGGMITLDQEAVFP